ncbi:hypothetical protein VT84_05105 [Gemmata sp. SH-PL17]|uniref:hypothetical protein n=1 Tax=Gemmata sp. SH-PL17 TaxID=1630693 RepID=UPI0004B2E557|nr:hypothetical protein [Gemmata sp. SH-PL17]AMV23768.1 hypothetical protein VT84_05105 [Gemmata sp. SH-PL17]
MTTAPVATVPQPVLYVIWHKPHGKGQRWRKAGRAATHAEAFALIRGKGSWHIAPIHDPALAPIQEPDGPGYQKA